MAEELDEDVSAYATPLEALEIDSKTFTGLRTSSFHGNALRLQDVVRGEGENTYEKPRNLSKSFSSLRKKKTSSKSKENKKTKKSFAKSPHVYVRDKEGNVTFDPVIFGTDAFLSAGLKPEKTDVSSFVVLEPLENGSVIVSNWENGTCSMSQEQLRNERLLLQQKLEPRKSKLRMISKKLSKSKDDNKPGSKETEELANSILERKTYKLPAGAYSIRKGTAGFMFRTFMSTVVPVFLKPKTPHNMRLASVVLPVLKFRKKEYLLITQRQTRKNGSYNGIWVFPGGHVDAGESLETAAVRELREETGLNVGESMLTPLCCWQEFYVPKKLQYLIVVFFAEIEVEEEISEVEFVSTIGLQFKEVKRMAMMPSETWPLLALKQRSTTFFKHYEVNEEIESKEKAGNRISLRLDKTTVNTQCESEVDKVIGAEVTDYLVKATEFSVHDIYGHAHFSGTGGPHRFAVRQLLQYKFDHTLRNSQRKNSVSI